MKRMIDQKITDLTTETLPTIFKIMKDKGYSKSSSRQSALTDIVFTKELGEGKTISHCVSGWLTKTKFSNDLVIFLVNLGCDKKIFLHESNKN